MKIIVNTDITYIDGIMRVRAVPDDERQKRLICVKSDDLYF